MPENLGLAKALKTGHDEEGSIRRINGRELVINTRSILMDGKPAWRAGGICSGRPPARSDPQAQQQRPTRLHRPPQPEQSAGSKPGHARVRL